MNYSNFKQFFISRYRKNFGNGTILILFAFIMPIILALVGLITDLSRALIIKSELNKACMIASEEATKQINIDKAQKTGENILNDDYYRIIEYFFYNNISNIVNSQQASVTSLNYEIINSNSNPKYLIVSCKAKINCFFLKIFGFNFIEVSSFGNGRLKGFLP